MKATLLHVIEGNKRKFVIALLMGLLLNAFISVVSPLALKYLFDEGVIRGNFKLFVTLSICFVLVFTLWRLAQYGYRMYIQRLRIIVIKRLSLQMLNKYYELPYDEIIKRQQGYFISRVYDEVSSSAPPLLDCTFSLFNSVVTLLIASLIAITLSWQAALTILVSVPLVYAASNKYARKIRKIAKFEKEEEAKLRGVLGRAIGAHKIVKTFNLSNKIMASATRHLQSFGDAYICRFRAGARYETLSGTLMSYVETIATIGAGYQMLRGRLTFGGFMGFMNAFWLVIGSVRGIFDQVPELNRISGLIERLREFEGFDGRHANIQHGDTVKLEHASFAYNGKPVLENYEFEIEKGERVLVVGPNGSGKSTLAHLITGLLQPTAGATTTFPLSQISAVIYPHDFIPGTVKDNVSFANSKSEQANLERLMSDFGLEECCEKDPSELSAGQRKKLEVMMSLVKEADIYVLDEPLAGMDVDSKHRVMNEIFRCTHNKRLITIMHGDEEFHPMFDRILDLGGLMERYIHSKQKPG